MTPERSCKISLHDREKIVIFTENREISMNFEVSITCIIVRYLEWKGDDFRVFLSTLMLIFEPLGLKYTQKSTLFAKLVPLVLTIFGAKKVVFLTFCKLFWNCSEVD